MRRARATMLALALVLAVGLAAPAQAGSGKLMPVSGQVTTTVISQDTPCTQGGTGVWTELELSGDVAPLGPVTGTAAFCAVFKQPGTLPAALGGGVGYRVILVRPGGDADKTLVAADGTVTFRVSGKTTFSDKPEDLSVDTTVSMTENWVVTGGTGAYAGATGSVKATGVANALMFAGTGSITLDLTGGIVVP